MHWHELSDLQKRQYIDAESVFLALRDAEKTAQAVRGSMLWRTVHGKVYLIRTNADNSQKSLGPHSEDTQAVYDKFMARKKMSGERMTGLREALQLHQKLNRAHRVGRTPEIVVKILNQLHKSGISEHFITVGTHALFAYESACGVRFVDEALELGVETVIAGGGDGTQVAGLDIGVLDRDAAATASAQRQYGSGQRGQFQTGVLAWKRHVSPCCSDSWVYRLFTHTCCQPPDVGCQFVPQGCEAPAARAPSETLLKSAA